MNDIDLRPGNIYLVGCEYHRLTLDEHEDYIVSFPTIFPRNGEHFDYPSKKGILTSESSSIYQKDSNRNLRNISLGDRKGEGFLEVMLEKIFYKTGDPIAVVVAWDSYENDRVYFGINILGVDGEFECIRINRETSFKRIRWLDESTINAVLSS